MLDVFKQNPFRTALVFVPILMIALSYLLVGVYLTREKNDGHVGALLDDTWIHVRFADHVAQGEGLSYNHGEITFGATSPLWIFVLAGVYVLTAPPVMSQIDITILMSGVGYLLAVASITGFGWWLTRRAWVGFAAGLITALTGRFVWMGLSGMEITTFTMLCIIAIWSHAHDMQEKRTFGWRTGILVALATLARPEAYLLAVFISAEAFVLAPLRDSASRSVWWRQVRAGWRGIVAYGLLAGSYPLAALLQTGYPLPNTFRAKSQFGETFPTLPDDLYWQPHVDFGVAFIGLALIGTLFGLWKARRAEGTSVVAAAWHLVFVFGVLLLGSDRFVANHSRYVAPAIPFQALAAVIGIWAIAEIVKRLWATAYARLATVALVAMMAVITFTRGYDIGPPQVANDVYQLRKMHVAAGYWFKNTTTPDQLIALNDVGAIIHISDRRVLDLEGLVSPEVIDATYDTEDHTCEHDLQLARLMLKQPPRFLAVFPWFYPCLTNWQGALQAQHQFIITGPTVIAGGNLVVYEPLWQNWPMQLVVPADVTTVNALFEEGVELAGYQTEVVEDGLAVTLWWKADNRPRRDYHVFVHLVDAGGTQISQHDGQPQNHQFRTTLWRRGDIIADRHVIPLNDLRVLQGSELALRVGMYEFFSGQRLLRRGNEAGPPDFVVLPLTTSKPAAIFG